MFNSNFYQPNTTATKEMAEERLIKCGYKNFHFKGSSIVNGASFYFESEDGKELRVSDHCLTGRRAFDIIQIDLYEKKIMENPNNLRSRYLSGEITKKEYKIICKEKGFIFKP